MKNKPPLLLLGIVLVSPLVTARTLQAQSEFSFGAAHVYNDSINLADFKA